MDTATMQYIAHQCSKCQNATAYICASCPCGLCYMCKESHVQDLKTIDHDVTLYREKLNYIPTQERCLKHPNKVYKQYCELCHVPVCFYCRKHRKHKQTDIKAAYKERRQQHKDVIHTIRSEALFYRPVFLPEIKTELKTCQHQFSCYQTEMVAKANRLNNTINDVLNDLMCNVFCAFDFKHRCLKQKIEMIRHISFLKKYEKRYEQSSTRPLTFLLKRNRLRKILFTLHTSQLSMNKSFEKDDVVDSLSGIQITETERCIKNESVLKLMPVPEFHQSVKVKGIDRCLHISLVTKDRFWVSDVDNGLSLSNTAGDTLRHFDLEFEVREDIYNGLHTVNNKGELIFIHRNGINYLSEYFPFVKRKNLAWKKQCVYWSTLTGGLLVGMHNKKAGVGKVIRYNQAGENKQTIQFNKGRKLYRSPNYITENNNGDVVVSDFDYESGAVVVTEHGGKHRFSYTGHPPGSKIEPLGICTDGLSHILVCDYNTHTVHMIDKDGQFLSHLLRRPSGIFRPHSLSYDVNTHLLWVGAEYKNEVYVYRFISRRVVSTDLDTASANLIESSSKIQKSEKEKPKEGRKCLLKLTSTPKLLRSLTVEGVGGCGHISCVTSDRVWVSDDKNNIVLTNTKGDPLHHRDDICCNIIEEDLCNDILKRNLYHGLHTVNGERELIYIDIDFNINKLSKDMISVKSLYKFTGSKWMPYCVYWSPSTRDLLVAMYNDNEGRGKVTRYNEAGQLTQTIQYDNTGLVMYRRPLLITVNNNGDVVVSDNDIDSGAVIVTDIRGKHRFSYTGHPLGSELWPLGICTDALSHILVCDIITDAVQMIDGDGQFLSYLLTKPKEMEKPRSLSYDVNTHCLWVGSIHGNKLCVYRHITDAQRDEFALCSDEDSLSRPSTAL